MDWKTRLLKKIMRSARTLTGAALAAFLCLGFALGPGLSPAFAQSPEPFANLTLEIIASAMDEDPGKAAALAKDYVEAAKAQSGEDSPEYATAITWLAWVLQRQKKYAESAALLEEALAIREQAFAPNHALIATSLHNLAEVYAKQGRAEEAEALIVRAETIKAELSGVDALASMPRRIAQLKEAGKDAQADALQAEYLEKLETRFGPDALARAQEVFAEPVAEEHEGSSYAVVKVYYATDRKSTGESDPGERYEGERGPLVFGEAKVSIPRDHRLGEIETPSIWRLEWCADPERFVVLLSAKEMQQKRFFDEVAKRVGRAPGKSAFVFVHGYNVAFADAARRTAQVTYDLGFAGAPVFYSWPSQASFSGYKVDETNAEWSRHDFQEFLVDFAEQSNAEHIYLVAHSMGTRILTGALKELFLERPGLRERFDEVVLAAPDIDADTFRRDIAPKIAGPDVGTTLYASSGDYALTASKTFAGYPRAGDTTSGITIVDGIDTIDASALTTDFVGHSYYAASKSVLGDLRELLLKRKRATERARLAPVVIEEGRYWEFAEEDAPTP